MTGENISTVIDNNVNKWDPKHTNPNISPMLIESEEVEAKWHAMMTTPGTTIVVTPTSKIEDII